MSKSKTEIVKALDRAILLLTKVTLPPAVTSTNSHEFNAAIYNLKMSLEILSSIKQEGWPPAKKSLSGEDSLSVKDLLFKAAFLRNYLTHGYCMINSPNQPGVKDLSEFITTEIPDLLAALTSIVNSMQAGREPRVPVGYDINRITDSALYEHIGSYGNPMSAENMLIPASDRFSHILHHAKLLRDINYSNLPDQDTATLLKMAGLNQLAIICEAMKQISAPEVFRYLKLNADDAAISPLRYINTRNELAHVEGYKTSISKLQTLQAAMPALITKIVNGLAQEIVPLEQQAQQELEEVKAEVEAIGKLENLEYLEKLERQAQQELAQQPPGFPLTGYNMGIQSLPGLSLAQLAQSGGVPPPPPGPPPAQSPGGVPPPPPGPPPDRP